MSRDLDMPRLFSQLGTVGLTFYLAVYLCIAPILVLCTCAEGHVAYALEGHAEPACGHHDDGRSSKPDQQPAGQHDHTDIQIQADDCLTTKSESRCIVLALPAVLGVLNDYRFDSTRDLLRFCHRTSKPLLNLRASITTTILRI